MFSLVVFFFFFKQKTAYEVRISDWSSDVCSSDLRRGRRGRARSRGHGDGRGNGCRVVRGKRRDCQGLRVSTTLCLKRRRRLPGGSRRFPCPFSLSVFLVLYELRGVTGLSPLSAVGPRRTFSRSEEHTSALQSLMRISYAVFCLTKTKS